MAGTKGRSGRTAGTPNRATREARQAIASFVDGNADRLQEWLDAVAEGVRSEDTGDYIVPPNPEKAFSLFQSIIEYHVPKLARTELTGKDGEDIKQSISINVGFGS
jgi:hypothetical protein